MRIDRTELQKLLQIYGAEQARREESKRDKAKAAEEGVTLSLSPEALSLNRLREELQQLPEVREERVRDLKEKIERGEYRPDPRKIAEGMVQEHRLDRRV